jgi:hypothetical protein
LSIAAGRGFIARQALELKPIEKLKHKITTKSPTEFRPPEPLLIVNYSRLFERPLDLYFNIYINILLLLHFLFLFLFFFNNSLFCVDNPSQVVGKI